MYAATSLNSGLFLAEYIETKTLDLAYTRQSFGRPAEDFVCAEIFRATPSRRKQKLAGRHRETKGHKHNRTMQPATRVAGVKEPRDAASLTLHSSRPQRPSKTFLGPPFGVQCSTRSPGRPADTRSCNGTACARMYEVSLNIISTSGLSQASSHQSRCATNPTD